MTNERVWEPGDSLVLPEVPAEMYAPDAVELPAELED